MTDRYDIIVVGGGFAGIYAAWRLARDGAAVALVEASDGIGGNLRSRQWNGYWVDSGTNNFDLRTPPGKTFYRDILGDNLKLLEHQEFASVTGQTWSKGIETPDLSCDYPEKSGIILSELKELEARLDRETAAPDDYVSWYRANYGQILCDTIMPMVKKFTGSNPAEFSTDARKLLGVFARIKLGSDRDMIVQKEASAFLNDRLSVTSHCGDTRFLGKNINKAFAYPAHKGLSGFCDRATRRLRELGVDILMGHPVSEIRDHVDAITVLAGGKQLSAKKLFWSLPEASLAKTLNLEPLLTNTVLPVGMCFFAFEVPVDTIRGPDYLHDFNVDRMTFRYNRQGVYSDQVKPDGSTLVMCEVPAPTAHVKDIATPENRAKAWSDLLTSGYLSSHAQYSAETCWSIPVAFTIPKVGWNPAYEKIHAQIRDCSRRIIGIEFGYRGRLSFMNYYDTKLESWLKS